MDYVCIVFMQQFYVEIDYVFDKGFWEYLDVVVIQKVDVVGCFIFFEDSIVFEMWVFMDDVVMVEWVLLGMKYGFGQYVLFVL